MTTKANTDSFTADEISRIIEMAWEDRTSFEAIEAQFALAEASVIQLMRRELKPSSFRLWRARVSGRKTKHLQQRSKAVNRFVCPSQYKRH
ncbi:MAG: TIGR03643 family protein [Pseudomonadales bacterium]|nr:TIGR03643 family protein [Pseudomonadales bacterium]